MIETTQKYKDCIYDDKTITRLQVNFESIDLTAKQTAQATSNDVTSFASAQNTINYANNTNMYTMLENGFLLDGTAKPFPDTPTGNYDYYGNNISNASGTFTANPKITYTWTNPHSTAGLTIKTITPILEMNIKAYNSSGTVIASKTWTNNDTTIELKTHQIELGMEEFTKIEIEIVKVLPYNRARILEVDFGIVFTFTDEIISATIQEQLDIKTQELASNQMTLTLNNIDNSYNKYNPDNFLRFLQKNQTLVCYSKVLTDVDTEIYELIPLGKFYLQNWNSPTQYTAQFVANDIIMNLSNNIYYKSPIYSNAKVSTIVGNILNEIGVEYEIDNDIANVTLSGYIPVTDYRSALQQVALSACCNVSVNRNGKIIFSKYADAEPVETIDYTMKQYAGDNEDGRYKTVEITYTELEAQEYDPDDETQELEFIFQGKVEAPARIEIPVATNINVIGSSDYTVYGTCVEIRNTTFRNYVIVEGLPYKESKHTVTKTLTNGTGQTMTISDISLVGKRETANNVATYVLNQLQHYVRNEFNWISNPALEVNDSVSIQVADNLYKTGKIIKNNFEFNGALKQTTEVII